MPAERSEMLRWSRSDKSLIGAAATACRTRAVERGSAGRPLPLHARRIGTVTLRVRDPDLVANFCRDAIG
ncbi:MAG: hypothetical protein ACJ8EL_03490 [Rhizomicrobium sp.]